MGALDHDEVIRDSFEAMDEANEGVISFEDFVTLFLGLGYSRNYVDGLEGEVRRIQSRSDNVTLETTQLVLSQYKRQLPDLRGYTLLDASKPSSATVQDIEILAAAAGDTISPQEAMEMIQLAKKSDPPRE